MYDASLMKDSKVLAFSTNPNSKICAFWSSNSTYQFIQHNNIQWSYLVSAQHEFFHSNFNEPPSLTLVCALGHCCAGAYLGSFVWSTDSRIRLWHQHESIESPCPCAIIYKWQTSYISTRKRLALVTVVNEYNK